MCVGLVGLGRGGAGPTTKRGLKMDGLPEEKREQLVELQSQMLGYSQSVKQASMQVRTGSKEEEGFVCFISLLNFGAGDTDAVERNRQEALAADDGRAGGDARGRQVVQESGQNVSGVVVVVVVVVFFFLKKKEKNENKFHSFVCQVCAHGKKSAGD